ncbi:MAG: PDZ domain-containing protein [Phycisphaerales bacterium]|nr:PDZ domain-containing protein [Phycisphaerales bacterium]
MQRNQNTPNLWLRRAGLLSLCTGLAAFTLMAGKPASAFLTTEPDEGEELAGNFDEPMNGGDERQGEGHGKARGGTSNFSWSSTTIDEDGSWTVTNKNGKLTVERDGKKIEKNLIRERRGQIEVLDGNGKVVKRLTTPSVNAGNGLSRMFLTPPPAPPAPAAPPRGWRGAAAPRAFGIATTNAPKVMLGVTMSDADDELLEQLGIDSGVLLVSVKQDLPAAKAGLQAKDVIFEVDGEDGIDEESLRETLHEKKPGDELKVKVKRKGEDKEFTIKLEAYDAGLLGQSGFNRSPNAENGDGEFDAEQLKAMLAEVEAHVKAQANALREQMNATDWNKVRDQVTVELDKAMKQMAEAREKAAAAGQMWWNNWNQGGQNSPDVLRLRELSAPRAVSRGGSPETDGKLDKLAEQLEKLNNRLDEMEKKIDKK